MAKSEPETNSPARTRLTSRCAGEPSVMQTMVSASTPMVAAVSPWTRIRLQIIAKVNSVGIAAHGVRPASPPAKVARAPISANVPMAAARVG